MVDNLKLKKKTLVMGASLKEIRYSNKAVKMLREYDHEVIAFGLRSGLIKDVDIITELVEIEALNTITLYLNPKNQEEYLDYFIRQKPKRIVFNPGTENPKLVAMAKEAGIETLEACTLVLLRTEQY